jgi:hypothetical protein
MSGAARMSDFQDLGVRYFAGLRAQVEMHLAATYDLAAFPGLAEDAVAQALHVMRRFPGRGRVTPQLVEEALCTAFRHRVLESDRHYAELAFLYRQALVPDDLYRVVKSYLMRASRRLVRSLRKDVRAATGDALPFPDFALPPAGR